jgi:hypothetical protein
LQSRNGANKGAGLESILRYSSLKSRFTDHEQPIDIRVPLG